MIKINKLKIIFQATLLIGVAATPCLGMNSLLLEPSVGYRTEQIKLTDLASNTSQIKSQSPVYGLKIGVKSMLGIDINLSTEYSEGKVELTPTDQQTKFSHLNTSVQLGVSALGLLKIYLGYAFINQLKIFDEPQFGLQAYELSGPAYLAGIQFRVFPSINLGAQYNLNQFNKINGKNYSLSESLDSYFSKVDSQDYNVYLSYSF